MRELLADKSITKIVEWFTIVINHPKEHVDQVIWTGILHPLITGILDEREECNKLRKTLENLVVANEDVIRQSEWSIVTLQTKAARQLLGKANKS